MSKDYTDQLKEILKTFPEKETVYFDANGNYYFNNKPGRKAVKRTEILSATSETSETPKAKKSKK